MKKKIEFISHFEIKPHYREDILPSLFVSHMKVLQYEHYHFFVDSLGKQTQPAFGRIKAASQSEFRTPCAVTRGNLFAEILSKQTQTC